MYDDNACKNPALEGGNVYNVDIQLRHGPATGTDSADANVMDVSACPKGYVSFRVNHPEDEEVAGFSASQAILCTVKNSSSGCGKKEKKFQSDGDQIIQ